MLHEQEVVLVWLHKCHYQINPVPPVTAWEKNPPVPCGTCNCLKKKHVGTVAFPTLAEEFLSLLLFYGLSHHSLRGL